MVDNCKTYFVPLLLWATLLLSCTKEPEGPTAPEGTKAITSVVHYRATVGEDARTKASLNNSNQYIFETGDQLYVVCGEDMYGVLNLVDGAGASTATFEGELMCLDDFEPTDASSLQATLVSKEDKIHTCADGKITKTDYAAANPVYASSFAEAIRYYSDFTATSTYGAHIFSLNQKSTFLIVSVTFNDSETAKIGGATTITATISNSGSPIRTGNVPVEEVDFSNQANFVAAFPSITLSNAAIEFKNGNTPISTDNDIATSGSVTLLANRYYEISRSHVDLTLFTIQAREDDTDVTFNYTGTIEYRINSGDWTSYSGTVNLPHQKDYVQFRSKRSSYDNNSGGTPVFTASKPVYIYGDIMSLMCDGSWAPKTSVGSNAFRKAFYNVTNIDIPAGRPLKLTATTLGNNCYQEMFRGCTSLSHAPELPATTISKYAYSNMFNGCTSLISAPELPATSVGEGGYQYMFNGCTALTTVPATIAGTSSKNACLYMFSGCTSLANAPSLPSIAVGDSGYSRMFKDCTSLIQAPELPATTLGSSCYYEMFMGCTSLVSTPSELPATTLTPSCYQNMFNGCQALTSAMEELPASVAAGNSYQGMFYRCYSLNRAPRLPLTTIGSSGCNQMFRECTSLVVAEGLEDVTSVGTNGCYQMFYGCGELTTTPSVLKSTTLPSAAYYQMYYNCAKITSAPDIQATTVGTSSCEQMFSGCRRLRVPPQALAVETVSEKAFKNMFNGCANLASAPDFTGMSTIGLEGCYQMFYGCTNLTVPPELPATTLGKSAYQGMFQGSALEEVPMLPATTLAESCYQSMFQNCKYLKGPAVLPAPVLVTNCYKDMFNGAIIFNSVVCLATSEITTGKCANWLNQVSATGTFVHPRDVTSWTLNSASGIPKGWTEQKPVEITFPGGGPFDNEEDL